MFENVVGGRRNLFFAAFGIVTLALLGLSLWVVFFVGGRVLEDESAVAPEDGRQVIYVNYTDRPDIWVDAASYRAMGRYQQEYPEPQNVQLLTGLNTAEITGYMLNHFSAGLGVNCTHCHSLENFAADVWDDPVAMQNKHTARLHIQMTGDLNQSWLTQLPDLTDDKQPSGSQIACATCHLGQAQPQAWPVPNGTLPLDFRLPLDAEFVTGEPNILSVTGNVDVSLDAVQYNQQVMYHMNSSLGVGCTHCHNSRYFPSQEVPAQHYAYNMLQMTQYIWQNYSDVIGGQQPSCNLCHYGNVIPPGAVLAAELMPPTIASDYEGSIFDFEIDPMMDMDTQAGG